MGEAMAGDAREIQCNRALKLGALGMFLVTLAALSHRIAQHGGSALVGPYDLLLLGLSTYRTGRLVAYERIAEPLRAPVTETKPDPSGVGETVVARGRGARQVLGELASCPICIGTWAAAGMVYGLHIAPRPTRVFLSIMATTGAAELLLEASEALSWLGRAARRHCAR